jgi:PTH1 family peptidyl-tRNA hydrolase
MKAIVGLGNPGSKYARSRHNVGFMVLDRLAEKQGVRFNQKRARSVMARGMIGENDVLLAKPETYMNLSGQAVQSLLMTFRLKPADLLVVYDDFDLPLGTLRLRERGGPGTHNGMRSIVGVIGTDFARLRVGIGSAVGAAARDHVLSDFGPEEWSTFEQSRDGAVEAIEAFVERGIATAMNRFNG